MRSEVVRVLEFVGEIDRIADADTLEQGLKTCVAPFGVSHLSVNLIHVPGRPVNPQVLVGEQWRSWGRTYVHNAFWEDDPAVKQLLTQARPFAWSEALAKYRTRGAEAVMGACFEHTGCREGFVVPVRDTDGAVLTGTFSGPAIDLSPEVRSALYLAGTYFVLRGREIVQGVDPAPACPLSSRQIDCLRWVRAGKTDAEIGVLLGISARTVHNHLEKAKAVLNTPKRAVAALEAWQRGWLS